MLKLTIFVAILGLTSAQLRSSGNPKDIVIVKQTSENDGLGTFSYSYENSDGSSAGQSGFLKAAVGTAEPAQEIKGFYSYTGPKGDLIKVDYIANELGFQASGAALPTPPPTPEAILRSLEFIAAQQGRTNPAAPSPFRPPTQAARPQQGFRG